MLILVHMVKDMVGLFRLFSHQNIDPICAWSYWIIVYFEGVLLMLEGPTCIARVGEPTVFGVFMEEVVVVRERVPGVGFDEEIEGGCVIVFDWVRVDGECFCY